MDTLSPGHIDRDKILSSHHEIRQKYLLTMHQKLSEDTKRHLHRGFLIRLGMMEESLLILNEELGKIQGPISSYLSIRLTLFLNAYYLNLTGSLDNLAWALTYHHSLLPNIDESKREHRSFVQLVGKNFLSTLLQKQLTQLHGELELFRDWYWEIREFRDAAAHRIPLSVPLAVLSDADVEQRTDVDQRAAELITNGDYRDGMNLLRESFRLGTFEPIFVSETSGIKGYDLLARVDQDHNNWLKTVIDILQFGF